MKKIVLVCALIALIGISCSHNDPAPQSRGSVIDTAQAIPINSVFIPSQADSAQLLQRMQVVTETAERMFEKFLLASDCPRKKEIHELMANVSYWKLVPGRTDSNMGTPQLLGSSKKTYLMFCVVQKDIIARVKGPAAGENIFMYTTGPLITSSGRKIYLITVNQEKLFTADSIYLGSAFIHELVHVIHRIADATIARDDEYESWRLQTDVLKAQLSPENKKLYQLKVEEQQKKPYDYNQIFYDNTYWIQATFGSVKGYIDKFIFDVYGTKAYE